MQSTSQPLADFKVIDLTHGIAGPYATKLLADYGAEVLKVETPAGDPMRKIGSSKTGMLGPFFQTTNRNMVVNGVYSFPSGQSANFVFTTSPV